MPARVKTLDSRLGAPPARVATTVQPGSWRPPDATSTKRGYGYAWQKAREGHLRSHPFCAMCLDELGIGASLAKETVIVECAERNVAVPWACVVDHRVPHRGDQKLFWNRLNWQSLCTTHHSRDKQRSEQRARD